MYPWRRKICHAHFQRDRSWLIPLILQVKMTPICRLKKPNVSYLKWRQPSYVHQRLKSKLDDSWRASHSHRSWARWNTVTSESLTEEAYENQWCLPHSHSSTSNVNKGRGADPIILHWGLLPFPSSVTRDATRRDETSGRPDRHDAISYRHRRD